MMARRPRMPAVGAARGLKEDLRLVWVWGPGRWESVTTGPNGGPVVAKTPPKRAHRSKEWTGGYIGRQKWKGPGPRKGVQGPKGGEEWEREVKRGSGAYNKKTVARYCAGEVYSGVLKKLR